MGSYVYRPKVPITEGWLKPWSQGYILDATCREAELMKLIVKSQAPNITDGSLGKNRLDLHQRMKGKIYAFLCNTYSQLLFFWYVSLCSLYDRYAILREYKPSWLSLHGLRKYDTVMILIISYLWFLIYRVMTLDILAVYSENPPPLGGNVLASIFVSNCNVIGIISTLLDIH